ncbi:MAG: glutathione S-transferase family protein [Novosphingobium sp.]
MKVFGALLSPFVRKVALVAVEKGLDWDHVIINRKAPDPDFALASPFGKIPAIKDGDYTLADSSAIVCYLDTKHPMPRLIPADAEGLGRALWFDEVADAILGTAGTKVLFNRFVGPKILKVAGDEAVARQGEAELPPILAYIESATPESGWLLGSDFSIADISLASMFRTLGYVDLEPDATTHPRLAAWYDRVRARPSWQVVDEMEKRR